MSGVGGGLHLHVPHNPDPGNACCRVGCLLLALRYPLHPKYCSVQLNIISTRNPSFWWHFSPTTAPAPAALLVVPVFLFLLAATFVAVYWPPRVKPDGGLGFMDGVSFSSSNVYNSPCSFVSFSCRQCN